MIRARFAVPLLLAGVALAVYSCGEPSGRSPAASLVTAPSFAKTPAACDVSGLSSLARSYFSSPEQQTTTDTLKAMQNECSAGDSAAVVAGGWTILSAIDTISAAGTGGSADDGAGLANGVMTYMCGVSDLCTPAPTPSDTVAAVTAADLGSEGMFAVRAGGSTDIVAHGKVPFDGGNAAQWGVQTSTSWPQATGEGTILLYGAPGSLPPVKDVSIGDLAYRLHTFPRVPKFQDGELHVGVCYDQDVTLPAADTGNVLQRNGTLLQTYTPTFGDCRSPVSSRDGSGGLFALLGRVLLPQPLLALTSGPPSTGGSPIDFSHFAPVAANTAGRLQFVTPPTDGVDSTALAPFTVEALSGGGTQIERVKIELYLSSNSGVPAGAAFCNDSSPCPAPTATTVEGISGYGTVATFTGVTIYKPGGYQICATAPSSGTDFTFQDVCATIHIKNNN